MLRVIIFFSLLFFGYFFIYEKQLDITSLFADSAEKRNSSMVSKTSIEQFVEENKLENNGKVLILNFWASWCSPCMRELPSLNRLNGLYSKKGLKIITVNEDYEEQDKLINKVSKELGLDLHVVKDSEGKYTRNFNIEGLPVTIIFKDNKLIEKINGEIDFDSNEFRRKIDLLLQPSQRNSPSKNM